MKKRKNSGLLLAARAVASRAARRIGARVAVAGKRVARKYGKRLATYGVNELESRGRKLLETASGSARQRIARMNPDKITWIKGPKNTWDSSPKKYRIVKLPISGSRAWYWDVADTSWRRVPGSAHLTSLFDLKKACEKYERKSTMRKNSGQSYGYEDAKSDIQAAATQFGLNRDDAIRWSMGDIRSFVKVELTPRARRLGGGNAYTVYVSVGVNGRLKDRMDSHPRTDKGLLIEVKKAIAMIKKWASVVADATETKKTNPQSCADVSWPPHEPYQRVSRVPVYIPCSNPKTMRRNSDDGPVDIFATFSGKDTGKHPILDEALEIKRLAESSIAAPYCDAEISKISGAHRAKTYISLSLDPKSTWAHSIFQNSRFAMFVVSPEDKSIQMFNGGGITRFRKARYKTPAGAIQKINDWIASQPKKLANSSSHRRQNPKFPIKAIYDGGGGVGLIPVLIIGLHPKRYSNDPDQYEVVSKSKTSKIYPKGHTFLASKRALVAPDAIKRKKYGSYIVAHKHVLDE